MTDQLVVGPIFTQSHCTVFDHGLAAMNARDQNNISYLSSLYLFTTHALFPQASLSHLYLVPVARA